MIKKLTLSLLLCLLASYAHASDSFSVAPDANSGTPFFRAFQQGSEGEAGTSYNAILPKIIVSYVPSGNLFDTLGNNAAGQAPDLGAVQAIVIYLAQVFQQKASAGATGKLVWSIPMYFIIFGLFLSGFLTWQAVGQGTQQAASGLLPRLGNWIEANPSQAAIASQAIGGAASSMLSSREREKELDILMERDRLNRDANQITGLQNVTVNNLPQMGEFLERPKWQMEDAGLLRAMNK
jgi:hypothetical protein